ncbi:hypothetical protein KCU88_g4333, partial [Aureobasidium melanogenum]
MDTSQPDDDWPLASSVEDCTLTQGYGATPRFAGGEAPQPWDAPTPAYHKDSQGHYRWTRSLSTSVFKHRPQGLGFVQMKDWDCDATYDEMPPAYIHYRVEWKLMINKTVVSKQTEEDIVLEPTSYGPQILLPCLEELLKRKVPPPQSARAEDTDVTGGRKIRG